MMNVLAICLVLTTLVTAGVWSPTPPPPEKPNSREEEAVIVKEGHRVVVVEFDEKDDGNTKVSISPQDAHQGQHNKPSEIDEKGYVSYVKEKVNEVVGDAKEKLKEASSSSSHEEEEEQNGLGHAHRPSARELVCDAFGKCKHRIASALGKTNDQMVSGKVHEATDKAYEVEEDVKEGVSDSTGKMKDRVTDMAHGVKGKVKDAAIGTKEVVEEGVKEAAEKAKSCAGKAKEAVEEGVKEAAEKAKRGAGKGKEFVEEGLREAAEKAKRSAGKAKEAVEERAREAAEKAKGGAEDVIDKTKRVKKDLEQNASGKKEKTKEKAEHASEKVKHGAHKIKKEGKDLKQILSRGLEVMYDVWAYVFSPESLGSFMGILHLLGFATAYGMCVWVTFLSSYVLAGVLPRQQFAMVQSKIYPVYFKAMACSVGMALLGHLLSQRKWLSLGSAEMFQGLNLLSSLLMVLVNMIYLEPRASKVMFERLKWEKEEGRGKDDASTEPSTRVFDVVPEEPSGTAPGTTHSRTATATTAPVAAATTDERPFNIIKLSETLKKLNSYSSFLNVSTLMGLTWHLVHAGHRLHTAAC